MPDSAPSTGYRLVVETLSDGIAVSIPSRRNLLAVVFLCAWLVGWLIGETRVIGQLMPSTAIHETAERLSLIYWLLAWTLGGAMGLVMLLWNLGGRERIVAQHDALSIRLAVFGIGFTRGYEWRFVKNLRVVEKTTGAATPTPSSISDALARLDGPLAFDYRGKTVQFGGRVDADEAQFLLLRLNAAKSAPTNS